MTNNTSDTTTDTTTNATTVEAVVRNGIDTSVDVPDETDDVAVLVVNPTRTEPTVWIETRSTHHVVSPREYHNVILTSRHGFVPEQDAVAEWLNCPATVALLRQVVEGHITHDGFGSLSEDAREAWITLTSQWQALPAARWVDPDVYIGDSPNLDDLLRDPPLVDDDPNLGRVLGGQEALDAARDRRILDAIKEGHNFERSSRDVLDEWVHEHAELIGSVIHADYYSNVYWYNDQFETYRIMGHCVDLGRLALVWTESDEAGRDDIEVIENDNPDTEEVARKHAEGVVGQLGTVYDPDQDEIPVARVRPMQDFIVPPECQGQGVEYAYSYDYDREWIIERRREGVDSPTYRAYEVWNRDEDIEPWNGKPTLGPEVGLVVLR